MGERSVLSVGDKKRFVPTKNKILLQTSKILLTVSPFFGVNTSVSAVLEIFSDKK
jgi:hypothetical protein